MAQGTDVDWFDDLNPHGLVVSGARGVAQAIYHRLLTPADSVPGLPGYGFDVRSLLNEDGTAGTPFQIAAAVEGQALKDERVANVTVSVRALPREQRMILELRGMCGDGPFDLVLSASELAVDRLQP